MNIALYQVMHMQENTRTQPLPFLPGQLQQLLKEQEGQVEEIRLRIGRPVVLTLAAEKKTLPLTATPELIREVVNRATDYSLYAFQESIQQGFLTVSGGHRLGFCGSVVLKDGNVQGFREVSSLNIRLAAQHKGVADFCISQTIRKDTLILSPPGCGKTTLLRDLVRQLSEQGNCVGVADERSEICGMWRGAPQLDVGPCTDVIDGCPKAQAAVMLIKAMAPDYLVMDEVLTEEDVHAVQYASRSGAHILLSAHGWNCEDFQKKPLFHKLTAGGWLDQIIEIQKQGGKRSYILRRREGERFV